MLHFWSEVWGWVCKQASVFLLSASVPSTEALVVETVTEHAQSPMLRECPLHPGAGTHALHCPGPPASPLWETPVQYSPFPAGLLQAHTCLHPDPKEGPQGLLCSSHGALDLPDRPAEDSIQELGILPSTPWLYLVLRWHHRFRLFLQAGRWALAFCCHRGVVWLFLWNLCWASTKSPQKLHRTKTSVCRTAVSRC